MVLYVKKIDGKLTGYSYDPRVNNGRLARSMVEGEAEEVVVEVTEEQWLQGENGKNADIIDGVFTLLTADQIVHIPGNMPFEIDYTKRVNIGNNQLAPFDCFVSMTSTNWGGSCDAQIRPVGTTANQQVAYATNDAQVAIPFEFFAKKGDMIYGYKARQIRLFPFK